MAPKTKATAKRPGRKPKDHVRVHMKIPTDLLARADKASARKGLTRTAFFELSIAAFLKRKG